MADRGRDLKVSILSDVERFDLTRPATELEELGDAAKDAEKTLDKSIDDMGKSVSGLDDKARTTATKVDAAFEKIAKSSKSNLRKVDDDARDAKKGLDGLKDEAGQSGREAAASFSGGFDSVTDFMQETAANALGGFGAVGGALGIAAAAGLGFMANKAAEAAENIKAVTENLTSLYRAGSGSASGLDKATAFIDHLTDSGRDLPGAQRALDLLGLTMSDFVDIVQRGGPGLDALQEQMFNVANEASGLKGFVDSDTRAMQDLLSATQEYETGNKNAVETAKLASEALAKHEEDVRRAERAQADAALAAERHAEMIGGVAESLRGASEESGALAESIAEDGQVSIQAVTEALEKQTEAARKHKGNLRVALEEGGAEFLEWMSQQPAEVAEAYVKGSDAERAKLRRAASLNGIAIGEGTAAGVVASRPTTVAAAAATHEHVRRKLEGDTINIPVSVQARMDRVDAIRGEMQRRFGTIVVNVAPNVQFGAGRYIP